MTPEHLSPAPWRVVPENGFTVADAAGNTLVLYPGNTVPMCQANARLIAAAPALLAALHELTIWAGNTSAGRGSWQYINACVALCRATGQQYQDTHYPPTPKEEPTP
jgi:hypothetical protein